MVKKAVCIRVYGARGSHPAAGGEFSKYGGDTACIAAFLPAGPLIFDAGTGLIGLGRTLAARREAAPIRIFLSHLHYDHVLGLPFFAPVYQSERDITIHMAENMLEPLRALWDRPYFPVPLLRCAARIKLVGLAPVACLDLEEGRTLHVRCLYPTAHEDGVTMYRLSGPGGDVVYVTDVELDSRQMAAEVAAFVRGAAVLLCDAQYLPGADYEQHRGWGHNNLEMAQLLAREAGVGELYLIHHEPTRDDAQLDMLAAEVAAARPPIRVAGVQTCFCLD